MLLTRYSHFVMARALMILRQIVDYNLSLSVNLRLLGKRWPVFAGIIQPLLYKNYDEYVRLFALHVPWRGRF